MIPLVHDFEGETVLVFGGGTVGARKARRFAREADVVVVSPAFAEAKFGGVEKIRAAPDPDAVDDWIEDTDPALVVAATDDSELNEAIDSAASDRGILVNRTDVSGSRDSGSVVVPATVRADPVVVAISTGGQSPALSRYLRKELDAAIQNAGEMATLTGSLRTELQDTKLPAEDRRAALRAVVRNEDVWKALDTGDNKARMTATDVISDVTGESL